MKLGFAACLLIGACCSAHAAPELTNMPCAEIIDYRQDYLFKFTGDLGSLKSFLQDYGRTLASAPPSERDHKLLELKFMVLNTIQGEHELVDFYATHHYPPKSDAVIAPVVRFIRSEAFQKEEGRLALGHDDIERDDFPQIKIIVNHFLKFPTPSDRDMEQYIDEAVYGGNPPRGAQVI